MRKIYILFFAMLFYINLSSQMRKLETTTFIQKHADYSTFQVLFDTVQVEWVSHYNGPGNNVDYAKDIVVENSANVYVTGWSTGLGSGYDYATIKYNVSGSEEWITRYNGPGNFNDQVNSMAIDILGNVYVTGASFSGGQGFDYATIKYNSSGTEEWVARYNGPANRSDDAKAISVDRSGNVYVAGASLGTSVTLDVDYATIKYNSLGTEEWVARYSGPGNWPDQLYDMAIDSSGNVYVTGFGFFSNDHYDYVTIKYDASGTEEWIARYIGPVYDDIATAIALDDSGNVYVTGWSRFEFGGANYDYATVKYNASGSEEWVARYNGPGNDWELPTAIAVDDSGNVYVTGESTGSSSGEDFATIKYNTLGAEEWIARYNGPGNSDDGATDIAIDSSGNVYVTGWSTGLGSSYDYATIKYNASGTEEWVLRYNGSGNSDDEAYAIAIDSLGNVYVTGQSTGLGSSYDFTTIKYKQISPLQIPLAPTNLQAVSDTMMVVLNWQDNSNNETGFVIEKKNGDSTSTNPFHKIDTVSANMINYTDTSFSSDTVYSYRVYAYNYYGNSDFSNIISVLVPIPVIVYEDIIFPKQFSLSQNFPNPFNPKTVIKYQIPETRFITLKVYDVLGNEIVTLVNEEKHIGNYEVEFNATALPSGIYFYRIQAGSFVETKKMIVMK